MYIHAIILQFETNAILFGPVDKLVDGHMRQSLVNQAQHDGSPRLSRFRQYNAIDIAPVAVGHV